MDPNNPKAPARPPTYEDGVDEQGNPTDETDPKNSKYFSERTILNDGTIIIKVYERHTNRLVNTAEAPKPNPDQKKIWDDKQKQAQTQTDQAERKIVRTYTGVDPNTGRPAIITEYETGAPKYEEIKPGARSVASVRYEPRNGKQVKITTYTDGTETTEEAAPAAAGSGPTKDINGTTYQQQPDGTWKPAQGLPSDTSAVKPKYVQVKPDEATGQWYGLTPQGTWEPIQGGPGSQGAGPPVPASASGWSPDPSQPDLGLGKRRADVAGMLSAGVFGDPTSPASVAKANDLLKGDFSIAQTTATNLGNIQSGETTIYSGSISQRGQDTSTANTRLGAAQSIFTNALDTAMKLAPYQKKGSGAAYAAFNEILEKARAYAEQFGGLKDQPRIEPGPNLGRTAPIYQPGQVAPTVGPTVAPPAMAPVQPAAAAPAPAQPAFVPPPTGAPRTAPPQSAPVPVPAPVPQTPSSSEYGPFDPPGYGPQPTAPVTGPQPGDFPDTPPPPGTGSYTGMTPAQAGQQMVGAPPAPVTGGTLAWANELGFSPDVIAAWAAQQAQQFQPQGVA